MTKPRFQMLTREALIAELEKLRISMEPAELDTLVGMDLLPMEMLEDGAFPAFAIVQLVEAVALREAGELSSLRRRAGVLRAALRGTHSGLTSAHREIKEVLVRRAVFGELHRMLAVMEKSALESLRGDARLEWRMRVALAELEALIPQARPDDADTDAHVFDRTSVQTPIEAPEMAARAEARVRAFASDDADSRAADTADESAAVDPTAEKSAAVDPTALRPTAVASNASEPEASDSIVFKSTASESTVPAGGASERAAEPLVGGAVQMPAPAPEPYRPGPDDHHPPHFAGGLDHAARMPVLRHDADTGGSVESSVQRTSVFPVPSGELADVAQAERLSPPPSGPSDIAPGSTLEEAAGGTWDASPQDRAGTNETGIQPAVMMTESRLSRLEDVMPRGPGSAEVATRDLATVPDQDAVDAARLRGSEVGQRTLPATGPSVWFPELAVDDADLHGEFGRRPVASYSDEFEAALEEVSSPTERIDLFGAKPDTPSPVPMSQAEPERAQVEPANAQAEPANAQVEPGNAQVEPAMAPVAPVAVVPEPTVLEAATAAQGTAAQSTAAQGTAKKNASDVDASDMGAPGSNSETVTPRDAASVASPADAPTHAVASTPDAESGVTSKAASSSGKFAFLADSLPSMDDISAHTTLGDGSVELPPRRSEPSVDLDSVLRNPSAALSASVAMLAQDPKSRVAVAQLVALLNASDEAVSAAAWDALEPALNEPGFESTHYSARVVMAGRAESLTQRFGHLVAAAQLADENLDSPQQALELLAEAYALEPGDTSTLQRAKELAEAHGLWAVLAQELEIRVRRSGSPDWMVPVALSASDIARDKLADPERSASILEYLVSKEIYDETVVARLVDFYAGARRSGDTLRLLLRCAHLAEGPDKVARLSRAADLCAEELGDSDQAMEIYESAMIHDAGHVMRTRYFELARRVSRRERALEYLAPLDGTVAGAQAQAEYARQHFADAPEFEIRALRAAYDATDRASDEQVPTGFALADCLRRVGHPTGEQDTLEAMLHRTSGDANRLAVVRRLAPVYAAQEDGTERAIDLYRAAVETGAFDSKIVHALTSLLRAQGRDEDMVAAVWEAAERAPDAEHRQLYLRQLAALADGLGDAEHALGLLEEVADASDGDPVVLCALSERFRAVGNEIAELGALEQAAASGQELPAARFLVRLAELELTRPRGAHRAVTLLERALATDELDAEQMANVRRLLPEVTRQSGQSALEVRMCLQDAEVALDAMQALTLYERAIALQEADGAEASERVSATSKALRAANAAGVTGERLAQLCLSSAHAKQAVGHWNAAVDGAARALELFIGIDPQSPDTLKAAQEIAAVCAFVVDEMPALSALEFAASTGVPALRMVHADGLIALVRWADAVALLEALAATLDPDDPLAQQVSERLDIARMNAA